MRSLFGILLIAAALAVLGTIAFLVVTDLGDDAKWNAIAAAPGKRLAVESKDGKDPLTGKEVMMDLPKHQMLRNLPDGGGCCVWASTDMIARWHNMRELVGILNDRLGGANKDDVVRHFKRRAPSFNAYAQATGKESMQLIDWAMRNGRIAGVTYGWGENYGSNIRHMVICVHCDPEGTQNARACIVDNNFPGVYLWMPRSEFQRRHELMGAWSLALLVPPPPPNPLFP